MVRSEEQRRRHILRTVARCVSERGIAGATFRGVAEEAQVSTGMLTYYYGTKREMITATLEQASVHLAERMDATVGPEPGPARLKAVFDLILGHPDEETPPWTFWLEYWAEAGRDPEMREYQAARMRNFRESVIASLEAGVRQGTYAPDLDVGLAAEVVVALFHGLGTRVTLDEAMTRERAVAVAEFALSLFERPKAQKP